MDLELGVSRPSFGECLEIFNDFCLVVIFRLLERGFLSFVPDIWICSIRKKPFDDFDMATIGRLMKGSCTIVAPRFYVMLTCK
jgi:hypothetical protein